MLHIILMILKILGILILCVLGLVLCVGLLVLFCPVRYHLEGSLYGKPEGNVRVTWLLHLVNVLFSYKENQIEFKLCIFGIPLGKKKESREAGKRRKTEAEKIPNKRTAKGQKKAERKGY